MPAVPTAAQIRYLRGQAHDLKPLLQTGGKGITPALLAELHNVLEHHELIKIKVSAEDRTVRDAMIADLVARSGSVLVQRIGHIAVLYRRNPENARIVLPSA
ncbi:MAG: YhbY family RNA-binding protein [Xanthomonadaceae bacterium]|jgi:RNA-binding protein|nr:YhbY family RNA-binding protein [Xanthomonadaceae bacterium]